jgi:hypothetical protein
MIEQIKKELLALEEKHKIKILYAVESGSRAWGFASTDSDWDVRFFYVHQYDWYLSVDDKKDNIEIILPNDIDLAGWELRKALLLYKKSNPPLFEWLRSPIVYLEHQELAPMLRSRSQTYFSPRSCIYHYLHMARRNWEAYFKEEEARVKKYFYVLRPLLACSWIERMNTMAPMEFHSLLDSENIEGRLRTEIDKLLERKINGEELDKGPRIPVIDHYIEKQIAHFMSIVSDIDGTSNITNEELNSIFRHTLKEAWADTSIPA